MEANIGAQDKKIRIGAGIVLLLLGLFVFKGNLLLIILGFVALITGLLNFCPAYKLLGMNTVGGTGLSETLDSTKDAVNSATEAMRETASDVADKAGEVVEDAADTVGDAASNIKEAASDAIDEAVDTIKKD